MKDFTDTITGVSGFIIAVIPQYIETLDSSVKILAGIGGLALLWYSIQLKRLQIKKEKEQSKQNEKAN